MPSEPYWEEMYTKHKKYWKIMLDRVNGKHINLFWTVLLCLRTLLPAALYTMTVSMSE